MPECQKEWQGCLPNRLGQCMNASINAILPGQPPVDGPGPSPRATIRSVPPGNPGTFTPVFPSHYGTTLVIPPPLMSNATLPPPHPTIPLTTSLTCQPTLPPGLPNWYHLPTLSHPDWHHPLPALNLWTQLVSISNTHPLQL